MTAKSIITEVLATGHHSVFWHNKLMEKTHKVLENCTEEKTQKEGQGQGRSRIKKEHCLGLCVLVVAVRTGSGT